MRLLVVRGAVEVVVVEGGGRCHDYDLRAWSCWPGEEAEAEVVDNQNGEGTLSRRVNTCPVAPWASLVS